MTYVDDAMKRFEKLDDNSTEHSVLQKLLKIDRQYAIVMAFDMLFAGVDTVQSSLLFKK